MSQTKFKDGKSPWAGTAWERTGITMNTKPSKHKATLTQETESSSKAAQAKAAPKPIDVESLVITNDPMPPKRVTSSKYDDLFAKLTYGHCIKCGPEEAGRIAATLVKWLKTKQRSGKVRSVQHYGTDGKGRVWLLKD